MHLMDNIIPTIFIAAVISGIISLLFLNNVILLTVLKLLFVIALIVFVIGPFIFKFSYFLQRHSIFLNYVSWPKDSDYDHPEKYGLNGTRNFYLETDDGIKLGVWQLLPESLVKENTSTSDEQYYENSLSHGQPVFIYMHGNSGNRLTEHRLHLYKVLRQYYHIIAFDYRSYGDSSNVEPSEKGVVNDAIAVIKWVKNITNVKVFVWGHSLGTGISLHALHLLGIKNIHIDGLVLESPFNNIRTEIGEHPLAVLFKYIPWFKYTIVDPVYDNGIKFESDKHIQYVNCPIIILHAEQDFIVPFKLGYELYSTASKHRTNNQGVIKFIKFSKEFGHKYICKAPDLSNIIQNFIEESIKVNLK